MLSLKLPVILSSFIILLDSCDCVQVARAKVADAETRQPVDSVAVFKKSRPHQTAIKDVNGRFELKSISGGLSGCPPMTVVLNKKGYQEKTVEVNSDKANVIYLLHD